MKKIIIPSSFLAPKVAILPAKVSKMTPDKIRQAKSKHALLESGGKRISVNLTGQAVKDLEAIKRRSGLDNTGAVIKALSDQSKK